MAFAVVAIIRRRDRRTLLTVGILVVLTLSPTVVKLRNEGRPLTDLVKRSSFETLLRPYLRIFTPSVALSSTHEDLNPIKPATDSAVDLLLENLDVDPWTLCFHISGMSCEACASRVSGRLQGLQSVETAQVYFDRKLVVVKLKTWARSATGSSSLAEQQIIDAVQELSDDYRVKRIRKEF